MSAIKKTRYGRLVAPTFFGDGCWGREPRYPTKKRKYLDFAASVNHLWQVEITDKQIHYRAVSAGLDSSHAVHEFRQAVP